MKRFKNLRKKCAVAINIMMVLQVLTVGMFLGTGTAFAATGSADSLVVLNPTPIEGSEISGLSVTVNGTATLSDSRNNYRVKITFSDAQVQFDNSFSGTSKNWSVTRSFASGGQYSATVDLQKRTHQNQSFQSVSEPITINFTLIYPAKPENLEVTGVLNGDRSNPSAKYRLSWDAVAGASRYKIEYQEVGATSDKDSDSSTGNIKTISGLKVNTDYEFTVQAVYERYRNGRLTAFSLSPVSDPVRGIVKTVTSEANSPEFSNDQEGEIKIEVEVEDGKNQVKYYHLYYRGPGEANYSKYIDQTTGKERFKAEEITFITTKEGLYEFYTVAVDEKYYRELVSSCEEETTSGEKCIPEAWTIYDITSPNAVSDLVAKANLGNITLTWSDPEDPRKDYMKSSAEVSGVGSIQVFRDGSYLGEVPVGTERFIDTAIDFNTDYEYYVTAADRAGNISEKSNTVKVTTLAEPYVAPIPVTPVQPAITQALAVTTPVYGYIPQLTQAPESEDNGEVKSDTTDGNDENKNENGNNEDKVETKEKRNVPLWGIIFLLILAGIGGYLFYTQSPEPDRKGKKKK